MAYTRRGGGGPGYMSSAASVGQRRPANQQGGNFTPGGPMAAQQQGALRQQQVHQQAHQQKPQPLMAPAQRQQIAQQQQGMRQQAQQFLSQQQQQQQPQQQPPPQQAQQQPPPAEQPKIVFKADEKPALETTNGTVDGDSSMDETLKRRQNKPFWMRNGKINKKERLRRRNQRLRKILQPKNALMVLNELIGSAPYNVSENPDLYEGTVFKCSVQVDGAEHVGLGKSKPAAKTAAAEAALKHLVLSKFKNVQSDPSAILPSLAALQEGDVEMKMDIESEENLGGISWSHVACYALHKLLSSWDEGTNLAERLVMATTGASHEGPKPFEKKPAKKLPDNANTMNPIMLLNQMHPGAVYEEVSKSGNPPNVMFTVKCTIGGEAFLGSGSTKKGARKMCAFGACQKILGIEYTPEFLEEHSFSEDAISCIPAAAVA